MASTLELLDAIDAQAEENVCIVDAVNRTISVPENLRLLGVESDEKAEIIRFRCPKIVGNNIDLTTLILFINFENAGGQKGAYRIKDVEEDGDGTNITFSWELERKVTAYQGTPKFSLCAQRVKSGDDGTLEQEWNTTFNTECEVLEGLEVQDSIEEEETAALTQIWQKIDELELLIGEGGSGGVKQEMDPTVPSWAKEPTKPTYTASEVGADVSGTAETKVTEHNVDDEAHNDIRLLVQGLTQKLNALADSDDDTLDQLSEIVAYIKNNKSLIDGITTSKVNVSDIINNLTTNVSNKPLSAAQGVALKALIDGITIPETLPNPQKLKFTGAVTAEYDGSTEQTVNIPESTGNNSYTLPIMSNTQLGGGKAVSKTDEDVPVAVDSKTGQLFVPKSASADIPRQEMQNTDTAVTLEPNKLYIFPEMASLTVTLAEPDNSNVANEYHFFFTSGATATTLTLNDVLSDAYSIEANMKYEVSILEGVAYIKGVSMNET